VPWAIVLAGGEGVRLRPLVRQLCGDERPKQFVKVVGSKSLLGHTLDRVGLKIPPSRTVISACCAHDGYLTQEFPETPAQRILAQPQDRGTAAGILFPAHWIHSQDPEAVVSIFPADHFILEEGAFMPHIANLAAFVRPQPSRTVLVGAPASTSETISPAQREQAERPGLYGKGHAASGRNGSTSFPSSRSRASWHLTQSAAQGMTCRRLCPISRSQRVQIPKDSSRTRLRAA
jgi:hypothetical protein